jgi:hypothetical protein
MPLVGSKIAVNFLFQSGAGDVYDGWSRNLCSTRLSLTKDIDFGIDSVVTLSFSLLIADILTKSQISEGTNIDGARSQRPTNIASQMADPCVLWLASNMLRGPSSV